MKIPFTKASGAGNDFVILDNRSATLPGNQAALARSLCDRHFGVGGDGLLVLERSDRADFSMKYYNADGSTGGMCGNGGRCVARFAFLRGIAGPVQRFEALDYVYQAQVLDDRVRLSMKDPGSIALSLDISVPSETIESLHFIDTGSPHVVAFVPDLGAVRVQETGSYLRRHPRFLPAGTNANFVQRAGANLIQVRTYERGVEAETLACGTGSVASAIVSTIVYSLQMPVRVKVKSGEELLVTLEREGSKISCVTLEGSAHMVFEGTVEFNEASGLIS